MSEEEEKEEEEQEEMEEQEEKEEEEVQQEEQEEEEDQEWLLPKVELDFDKPAEITREYGTRLYHRIEDVGGLLKELSINTYRNRIIAGFIKGSFERRLSHVTQKDLWMAIKDGDDPSKYVSDGDLVLPSGTVETLRRIDRLPGIDVAENAKTIDKVLRKKGGDLFIIALKDTRPDLYEVLMTEELIKQGDDLEKVEVPRNGAENFIWYQIRQARLDLRKAIKRL